MNLTVKFEVHLFSENELHDDQIECRKKGYGLYSTEFYTRLFRLIDKQISFELFDEITIGEVKDLIYSHVWETYNEIEESLVCFAFITPNFNYFIESPEKIFHIVLNKYLDPEAKGEVTVGLYICEDAGHFVQDGKLQFDFRSHEDGAHHEPHVHVNVIGKEYSEPISVLTGESLNKKPKMPQKYLAQAKNYILDNKCKFLKGWNALTDGLKIDIDKALGLSEI